MSKKIKPKAGDFFYGKQKGHRNDFMIKGRNMFHVYHDLGPISTLAMRLMSKELIFNTDDGYHEMASRGDCFLNPTEWEYIGNIYEVN